MKTDYTPRGHGASKLSALQRAEHEEKSFCPKSRTPPKQSVIQLQWILHAFGTFPIEGWLQNTD